MPASASSSRRPRRGSANGACGASRSKASNRTSAWCPKQPPWLRAARAPRFRRKRPRRWPSPNSYETGSIVIDTAGRRLYYTLSASEAYSYPVAVGKQGFTWTGVEKVSKIEDWPDWIPPAEMRARKPSLPLRMTGGLNNPLGVKAIYLGSTLYRIHGTNDAELIGEAASSGCFRMHNEHVVHLAGLVNANTTVYVLKRLPKDAPGAAPEAKTDPAAASERAEDLR